jgi:hypothetical protein
MAQKAGDEMQVPNMSEIYEQQGLYPPPGVPSGSTWNDSESMQICMDSKQGVELSFTCVLASPICMDPCGF